MRPTSLSPGVVLRALRRRARLLLADLRLRSPRRRRALFHSYFEDNYWGDAESRSGPGSNLANTANIRAELPGLLRSLEIKKLVDVPCGDAFWIRHVETELEEYVGVDVVPELVEQLKKSARPREQFVCADAIEGPLPTGDAVMIRDLFIHLSERHIKAVLANVRKSGARYLIASSYRERGNRDGVTGGFRFVNLERAPYDLGEPIAMIDEGYAKHPDKILGVWDISRSAV